MPKRKTSVSTPVPARSTTAPASCAMPPSMSTGSTALPSAAMTPWKLCRTRTSLPPRTPGSWALRWGTLCASTPAPAARRPVISRAAFWTISSAWASAGFAKYLADNHITLPRRTYVHVTVYEEVGHGGASSVPAGVTEAISVDMGCVGEGLTCTERQVSICAKDSVGPYSYEVVGKLIDAAKKMGADYAVGRLSPLWLRRGRDLRAGFDIRHGLIGAGCLRQPRLRAQSHRRRVQHPQGDLRISGRVSGQAFSWDRPRRPVPAAFWENIVCPLDCVRQILYDNIKHMGERGETLRTRIV